MNGFVTAHAKDRRSQDLVGVRVDDHLHEALRLTLFHCPTDPGHRPLADQQLAAGRLGLSNTHPGPPQRRIDVEGVGGDAIADPAWVVIEQIGRNDLEIVVRRVSEGALAVAVAHRPSPRCGRHWS